MTTRNFRCHLILFAILAVCMLVPAISVAQAADPLIKQEYFVQQSVDEDLLITINAFEAEFEAKISGQNGEVILRSGMPGSRIVPVFQYINAPDNNRQLDIEVTSSLHTGRSEFGVELTRLKVWDDRSDSVSRAYKLLSFGMQSSSDTSAASWTVKIDSLVNAGRLFEQFGMQEMRLWANYMVAHLIQFHLHDYSIVYSMTREILAELKGTRLQKIELATLQLQSAALIGLKRSASLNIPAGGGDPVQMVLSRSSELANIMGFHVERALALKASGTEYAAASINDRALEKFQLAVELADAVGDEELATGIRESIVQIHALQGDTQASSKVLQKIETQLLEDGDGDELALNLLAQGRLMMRTYRYQQAIDTFYQALNHENDSAIRKQINFDLATAFYETGRLDESVAYLQLADVNPDSSQRRNLSPVFDVNKGLNILANIYRVRGNDVLMRKSRNAQNLYKPMASQYLYDRGLDELATQNRNRQKATVFFERSYKAAVDSGHVDLQHLSRMQFCASGGTDARCSTNSVNASYEWLLAAGVPRFAVEAMFLRAQIMVLNGQLAEAITILDQSISEIHMLRYSLPGVLGAWYTERHETLFEYYLELLVSASPRQDSADGLASLLVLSKIRYIEKHTGTDLVSYDISADTDLLRVQLAQREHASSAQGLSALNANINRGLANIRAPFEKKFESLSKPGLQKFLRGLANDEIVLTYHISPTSAQVWVGQKAKVLRLNIANPAYIYSALQEARQGLSELGVNSFNGKMEALGTRLMAPVSKLLSKKIYWIPAGPLLGFPLDALRLKGRYLVETHSVVNLMSFPANSNPGGDLQIARPNSVFLAGHPQDYTGEYATRLETSEEIKAVADIYVGPGLHIVQGTALLPDEFKSEHFQGAELIHLTMPAVIDLKNPQQSGFELSGDDSEPGRTSLRPIDIQSQKLRSQLVFLSATGVRENPLSAFTSQPGLVSDFIDAGARSVIARLWTVPGGTTEMFITDFYHQFEVSGNIVDSLTTAKRRSMEKERENGLYDWAGYQIFIN